MFWMTILQQDLYDILESIEDCLGKERPLSCLMLLYSTIDVVATLECEAGTGSRSDFIWWRKSTCYQEIS